MVPTYLPLNLGAFPPRIPMNGTEFLAFCVRLDPRSFNKVLDLISELKVGNDFNIYGELEPILRDATTDFISYISFHYPVMSVPTIRLYYDQSRGLTYPPHPVLVDGRDRRDSRRDSGHAASDYLSRDRGRSEDRDRSYNSRDRERGDRDRDRERDQGSKVADKDQNQLFIGGLARGVTLDSLNRFVSEITGSFLDIQMKQGFAFVTYASHDLAQRALDLLTGKEFQSRQLAVQFAAGKAKAPTKLRNSAIYISNLAPETTEQTVREHFSSFGEIEVMSVPRGKCFAIITYARLVDAEAAMSMNLKVIDGKAIYVTESKSDKSRRKSRSRSRSRSRRSRSRSPRR